MFRNSSNIMVLVATLNLAMKFKPCSVLDSRSSEWMKADEFGWVLLLRVFGGLLLPFFFWISATEYILYILFQTGKKRQDLTKAWPCFSCVFIINILDLWCTVQVGTCTNHIQVAQETNSAFFSFPGHFSQPICPWVKATWSLLFSRSLGILQNSAP